MTTAVPLIQLEGVSYRYGDAPMALNELNLTIYSGRRLVLLGGNGSGKTTVLLHLNGLLKPSSGRILLRGMPAPTRGEALRAWRRETGIVFQDPDDQLFSSSVFQDVSFGPVNLGLDETSARARVHQALQAMEISDLAHRATHMLSLGQKKRVALAGVLAMDPKILILDEPTAGLDTQSARRLWVSIEQRMQTGSTLVFTTHDVDLALAWSDDTAILEQGRVIGHGSTTDILADEALLSRAGLLGPVTLRMQKVLQRAGILEKDHLPFRTSEELMAHVKKRLL